MCAESGVYAVPLALGFMSLQGEASMETQYSTRQSVPHVSRRTLLQAGLVAGATFSAWPLRGPTTLWGAEVGQPKRGGILRVRGYDPVHICRSTPPEAFAEWRDALALKRVECVY